MRYLSTNIPLWSFLVPKKRHSGEWSSTSGWWTTVTAYVTAYVTPQAAQAAPGTHIEAEALVPSHGRPEVQWLLQQGPSRGRRHAARSQQGGQRHATWRGDPAVNFRSKPRDESNGWFQRKIRYFKCKNEWFLAGWWLGHPSEKY